MTGAEKFYVRPIPCPRAMPAAEALRPGLWCREVEVLTRGGPPRVLAVAAARALYPSSPLFHPVMRSDPLADRSPAVMGVVNMTPDSFSDGGQFQGAADAIAHGHRLVREGADILDIGGESTRPGAAAVSEAEEMDRVLPVIEGLRDAGVPISIDTRKAGVARAALGAGAVLVNDVSAFGFDAGMPRVAAEAEAVCLMHAQGTPETMQDRPRYDDVLLDIHDFLEERLQIAQLSGIDRSRILIDPGIGFGKRLEHNTALIRRLSLFAGLGPVLIGVSRKKFIGTLSGEAVAAHRVAGSVAAALAALDQGAAVLRVHDVADTVQAVRVWTAIAREIDT